MSKGTYLFHVDAGKVTYAGTYIVYADLDHIAGRIPYIGADGKPGEHGETEPTLTYKMDIDAAREALKSFKGINAEMISHEPEPVTFAP